jgi:hypothetical protein
MNLLASIGNRLVAKITAVVMAVILLLSAGYIWLQIGNGKHTALNVITSDSRHMACFIMIHGQPRDAELASPI